MGLRHINAENKVPILTIAKPEFSGSDAYARLYDEVARP